MLIDLSATVRQLCVNLEQEYGDATQELVASLRVLSEYREFWIRVARDSNKATLLDTDCFDTLLSFFDVMSTGKTCMLRYAICSIGYSAALGNRLQNNLVNLRHQLSTEKNYRERGYRRCRGRGAKDEQDKNFGEGKGSLEKSSKYRPKAVRNRVGG